MKLTGNLTLKISVKLDKVFKIAKNPKIPLFRIKGHYRHLLDTIGKKKIFIRSPLHFPAKPLSQIDFLSPYMLAKVSVYTQNNNKNFLFFQPLRFTKLKLILLLGSHAAFEHMRWN